MVVLYYFTNFFRTFYCVITIDHQNINQTLHICVLKISILQEIVGT